MDRAGIFLSGDGRQGRWRDFLADLELFEMAFQLMAGAVKKAFGGLRGHPEQFPNLGTAAILHLVELQCGPLSLIEASQCLADQGIAFGPFEAAVGGVRLASQGIAGVSMIA